MECDFSNRAKNMQDLPRTWRDLVGKIIEDPHERQRIANELGVSPVTLMRWATGESKPRLHNLRLLLRALPEHRKVLSELLAEEYGDFLDESTGAERAERLFSLEESSQEIPAIFYSRVLHAHADVPQVLRFTSICDLILQQALKQLDPNRVGMEITVVRCMSRHSAWGAGNRGTMEGRPNEHKIYSLREIVGRGTPPWNPDLEQKTLFLGIESLAGYLVTTGRLLAVHSSEEGQSLFPARWEPREQSAAGYPILRGDRVAGCLLFSSAQPRYFLPFRQTLVRNYAELIALAFEPAEFYEREQVELRVMPSSEEQKPHLTNFWRRVSTTMIEAVRSGQPINIIQAEQLVWQQIEEELLQLPFSRVE